MKMYLILINIMLDHALRGVLVGCSECLAAAYNTDTCPELHAAWPQVL